MTDDWKDRAAAILLPGEVVEEPPVAKPKRKPKKKAKKTKRKSRVRAPREARGQKGSSSPTTEILVKNMTASALRVPETGVILAPATEQVMALSVDSLTSSAWKNLVERGYVSLKDPSASLQEESPSSAEDLAIRARQEKGSKPGV